MKIKKVNRYSCDFCKKKTYTSSSMKSHEEYCTKNPKRKCRCCKFVDGVTADIKDLIAVLPDCDAHHNESDNPKECGIGFSSSLTDAANLALPKLRELTYGCPACILAAIRQSKIPTPLVTDFNFAEELKKVRDIYWSELRREESSYISIIGERYDASDAKKTLQECLDLECLKRKSSAH